MLTQIRLLQQGGAQSVRVVAPAGLEPRRMALPGHGDLGSCSGKIEDCGWDMRNRTSRDIMMLPATGRDTLRVGVPVRTQCDEPPAVVAIEPEPVAVRG